MRLFGWSTEEDNTEEQQLKSITPDPNDGSLVIDQKSVNEGVMGDAMGYSMSFDVDPEVISEQQLITKYREISRVPEVEFAIDDIINEMVSTEDNDLVDIDLDELDYAASLKQKISDEFKYVLNLLDFNTSGFDILKRWYVDGRMPYQVIINPTKYKEQGIAKLTYIDPRLIKKVRVVKGDKDIRTGANQYVHVANYYMYSETGFGANINTTTSQGEQGIKMSEESIVYATSGILNPTNTIVLSHLHKVIRPLNQLKSLEDAAIIYRLSRAPERRVFYIDVGNLPPAKAQQVLRQQMQQYRSKMVYDTASGTVRSDPRHMTMIEDYWLPRRSDGKATEITTLPGGQNLGEMTEVEYFLNKLYKALNVPTSRMDPQSGFNFGRVTEINRDELKFMKFVGRLRKRFSMLFLELLKRQLALKNILHPEEFDRIANKITFEYRSDNVFEEARNNEIMNGRLDLMAKLDPNTPLVGNYFSKGFIKRSILQQSEEDIDEMQAEMEAEKAAGEYEDQAAADQQVLQQQTMDQQNKLISSLASGVGAGQAVVQQQQQPAEAPAGAPVTVKPKTQTSASASKAAER